MCFENWWEKFEDIYDIEFVGKENEIGLYLGCFWIVMIVRIKVIKRVCDYMGKVMFIFNEMFIIDINNLIENEKDGIFVN